MQHHKNLTTSSTLSTAYLIEVRSTFLLEIPSVLGVLNLEH